MDNKSVSTNSESYKVAYQREKKARSEAEELLENKTRELYVAHQTLEKQYQELKNYSVELELFLSLAEIGQENVSLKKIIEFFVESVCQTCAWPVGHVYIPENIQSKFLVSSDIWYFSDSTKYQNLPNFFSEIELREKNSQTKPISEEKEKSYEITDLSKLPNFSKGYKEIGLQAILQVPIKSHGKDTFIAEFFMETYLIPEKRVCGLLQGFSDQVSMLLDRVQAEDEAKENNLKLQQALVDLQQLAHFDSVTSLPNRLLFEISLKREIAKAKRYGHRFAIFYIDLDYFKSVNDKFGHDVGDSLLKEVAKRLQETIREGDLVARLGGDEFAVILGQIENNQKVEEIAGRILKHLNKVYNIIEHDITISGSIGIACYPEAALDNVGLCKNADIAMYDAKEKGRNTYKYFSIAMQKQYKKRFEIENLLPFALERQEFFLVYQPVFQLNGKIIVGMEVLLRWESPSYGLISPEEFIGIAEEKGLIISIGKWVLDTACRQYMEWAKKREMVETLLINVSAYQLREKNFVESVIQTLNETGMSPHFLEFEITETAIMTDVEEIEKSLVTLHDLGIRIAIDDFGTGHSSLSRLKQLTVDTLKIDKSFIKDVNNIGTNDLIIKSIITLAKELKLTVIAEGVETKLQETYLMSNSDSLQAQGFYYSRPFAAAEFEVLLKRQ